jgi:hypothetical protein
MMRRDDIVGETALKIRELLDAAKKEYGAKAWEEDEAEDRVLGLVTDDGEGIPETK